MTQSHAAPSAVFTATLDLGIPSGPKAAIKDCIDIKGWQTICGSQTYADAPPAQDHAQVVADLLDHGWNILAKTNMHELAYGMTGVNAFTGTPLNPSWPDLIPGGSSSGSAVAVAAGLVDMAIGTDTGGSIRLPAACCGVIGLKPTFGLVSRQGATPAQSSLDCIGPFARDMDRIEAAMQAIAPSFAPQVLDVAPRLSRIKAQASTEVRETLLLALQDTGLSLPEVELPALEDAFTAAMTIIAAECHQAFGHLLAQAKPLGADIRSRLEAAAKVSADDIAAAEAIRSRFSAQVDAALQDCDALLLPALPSIPPSLEQAQDPKMVLPLSRFLRPFNLSGHPAIVLPMRSAGGMPVALQVIGRKHDDAKLCAIARWLVETLPRW